jgi:hypothetical protein
MTLTVMKTKDAELWQKCKDNNQDAYGGACMRVAERWADLMELDIEQGKTIKEVAAARFQQADADEGVTGFMYGAIVSTLSAVWVHGEKLRKWHNLGVQIRDEGEKANLSGGVLNPAILCIK